MNFLLTYYHENYIIHLILMIIYIFNFTLNNEPDASVLGIQLFIINYYNTIIFYQIITIV